MKTITAILILIAGCVCANAQEHVGVSENFADLACLGTLNVSGEMSIAEGLTVEAGVRYNNWNFRCDCDERAFQDRRRTFYAGARKWFTDSCSGVWATARLQLEEYNRGGLFRNQLTEEGNAAGIAAGGGYAWRLSDRLRLDAGLTFWAGGKTFNRYSGPRCGRCLTSCGHKSFVAYDSCILALTYLFPTKQNKNK